MDFEIISEPIDILQVTEKVMTKSAGAVTTFTGTVREFTKGKQTLYLIYEAYKEMAEKKLAQIGEEIQKQWPKRV